MTSLLIVDNPGPLGNVHCLQRWFDDVNNIIMPTLPEMYVYRIYLFIMLSFTSNKIISQAVRMRAFIVLFIFSRIYRHAHSARHVCTSTGFKITRQASMRLRIIV